MAATTDKFNGDIMGIYANGTLVAHAQDSSLSVSMDVIDTTEKDSNKWTEHIKGNRGWEISGNSLEVFASSMSVEQLIDFLINAESVSVQFKTTNVDDIIYLGNVSVVSTSFSAPQNSPAAFDFTFTGDGDLTKTTDQAQGLLNKFTGLSGAQISALNTYFTAEIANGNHALKDYELILSLGAINGLIDYVGDKTAVNNGAIFGLNGAAFSGAEDIDSDYNPTTDAVNYALDDMYVEGFIKVNNEAASNTQLYKATTSELFQNPGSSRLRYATNSAVTNDGSESVFADNSLYGASRDGASSQNVYKDGVSQASSAAASTSIPNTNFIIGSTGAGNFFDGTISTFMIAASVGFNFSAHNTNLRQLLTNLGLSI